MYDAASGSAIKRCPHSTHVTDCHDRTPVPARWHNTHIEEPATDTNISSQARSAPATASQASRLTSLLAGTGASSLSTSPPPTEPLSDFFALLYMLPYFVARFGTIAGNSGWPVGAAPKDCDVAGAFIGTAPVMPDWNCPCCMLWELRTEGLGDGCCCGACDAPVGAATDKSTSLDAVPTMLHHSATHQGRSKVHTVLLNCCQVEAFVCAYTAGVQKQLCALRCQGVPL